MCSLIWWCFSVVLFGGTFSLRFINVTPANHPVLNRLTVGVIVMAGAMATAGLLVPYRLMILPTILIAFIGCTTMLVLSIVRWLKKDPAARYYTLAWVFMLFGGIVLALSKFTDALTGLKNRGHFDRTFSSAVVKAYRFSQPLSLLLLDIDHFKKFNDTHGHLVGDDCLQMVANCIRDYVTRPQDLAARYGGEEFVVLLPDTPKEGALRVAEKIRSRIEETGFRVSDEVLHLTVSIGLCAVCPSQADATKDIFSWADGALYEAKGRGRNQVVVCEPPSVQGAEPVMT